MNIKSKQFSLLAGLLLGAAGIITSHAANSTIITFSVDMSTNVANANITPGTDTISVHGTFDGWTTGMVLVQQGSSYVYTNTVNDTNDANGGTIYYKFVNSNAAFSGTGGYEGLCDGGANRAVVLPSVSGSSLVLPTPFYGDGGAPSTAYATNITFQVDMSQRMNLGLFTNGVNSVDVSGNFNSWGQSNPLTNDPTIMRTNQFGLVTSNVYTGTFTSVAVSPNAHMAYQFVIDGTSYEGISGPASDEGGNRFFTASMNAQTLPVVDYAGAPYAPVVTNLQFSVDMSLVALTDTNFNPASVTINGDFMGWGGTPMTNNPTAANTNIFTSPMYADGVGASINYQYRYTLLSNPNSIVYDHANGANGGQGNRLFVLPNVSSTNVLSVFNDAVPSAYLFNSVAVTFSVDMNGAVGTEGHVFNASADNVYVNGQFPNWYPWAPGANPMPAPPGFQMVEVGTSTIYTNTVIFPGGSPVDFSYKYGIDINAALGGPDDDEAASGLNHGRVVRTLAQSPYVLPPDKFGNQYNEPFFGSANPSGGNLAVGGKSGGSVPVQWLGCPGARLAYSGSLKGPWQQILATDGTNWSAGFSSTNGLVSQTNWPTAGGNVYFRLIKPN